MLLIKCPWCGERDMVEFTHGGDATKVYPKDPDAATAEEWHEFGYRVTPSTKRFSKPSRQNTEES